MVTVQENATVLSLLWMLNLQCVPVQAIARLSVSCVVRIPKLSMVPTAMGGVGCPGPKHVDGSEMSIREAFQGPLTYLFPLASWTVAVTFVRPDCALTQQAMTKNSAINLAENLMGLFSHRLIVL